MTHPSFDIFELPNNAKGSILVPAPGVVCKTIEFYVPVATDKIVITGTIENIRIIKCK